MIVLRRIAGAAVMAVALTMALGSAAAPAQAAGRTLVVGIPGGSNCPYATTFSTGDIQAAVDATPQPRTIIVCPGDYSPVQIEGKHNLKLVARGAVSIVPSGPDFSGPLVYVHNSTRITVQGFFVDGDEAFGSGGGAGIWYDDSSGSIVKNRVLRIRESPIDTYSLFDYTGILVTGTGGQKVKVTSNTVQDFEWRGIAATGDVNVQVSKNRVSNGVYDSFGPCGCDVTPSGIVFEDVAAGSIKGNIVQSNFSFAVNSVLLGNFSYGIVVYQSAGIVVSGNSVTGVGMGVYVLDEGAGPSSLGASNNRISRNKVTDALIGILIEAYDIDGVALADPHIDHIRITGNKVVSNDLVAAGGIILTMSDDPGDDPIHPTAVGDVITGNKVLGLLFGDPYFIDPGAVNVVFKGNKTGLPKAGAAPAQPFDFSSLPRPYLSSAH